MKRSKPHESVVFKTGNSLAVRLVGDCKLPKGTRISERREGNLIVLEPISGWPKAFRAAIGSYADEIPRPAGETKQRDPFK